MKYLKISWIPENSNTPKNYVKDIFVGINDRDEVVKMVAYAFNNMPTAPLWPADLSFYRGPRWKIKNILLEEFLKGSRLSKEDFFISCI